MPLRHLPTALVAAIAALATVVPAGLTASSAFADAPAASAPSSAASSSAGSALPTVVPTSSTPVEATPSAPAAATPADAPVTITAVLAPSDRGGLRDLVDETGSLSTATRTDRLDDVAPDADGRPSVRATLAAAGFQVTDSGTWDLQATGTAAEAEALFGVTLVGSGDQIHPTGSVVMPAGFGGAVSSVLGLDARPIVTPTAVPGGLAPADLASAYGATASATAGTGATIATVQFSGWNSSDLSTYASAVDRPLPSVTQLSVDGASTTTPNGTGGELEVALDQEMLLAAAPAAAQRIYVAPESAQGMYDAYAQIAADVASSHITAVSTSWGTCEASIPASVRSVLEDAIDRIVAAGATMFAASGDAGAQCAGSPTGTSVLYPASSPAVVGVGGTSLTRSGSTWSETTWDNSSGSSGGGVSTVTARPSYQSGIAISGSERLVPDIAALADPNTGPGVYIASRGGWVLGGGTSLATPLMAGQLAATLTARGCAVGVGDVHAVLYAHPGDFRDVTTGNNGTYSAGSGYDLVTGLGSPNWTALSRDLPVPASCTSGSATGDTAAPAPTATASATPTPTATPTLTPAETPTTATGISSDGTRFVGTATLASGKAIHSPSGQYRLQMQTNGNLLERGNGQTLWSTGTSKYPGATFALQADGNAVLHSASGAVLFSTHTSGKGSGVVLAVTDTGLVTLTKGSTQLWSNRRPGANSLVPEAALTSGQAIWDTALRRQLIMQADGNVVLYIDGTARWSSHTDLMGGGRLVLQSDGNLVIYTTAGKAVWASNTSSLGGAGMRLTMQVTGNLALLKNGKVVWSTHTAG